MAEIAKFNQPNQISTRFFIEFLDLLDGLPPVKEVRRRIEDQMHLKPGAHALDIGCGNGTAARGVADRVGPEGPAPTSTSNDALRNRQVKRSFFRPGREATSDSNNSTA